MPASTETAICQRALAAAVSVVFIKARMRFAEGRPNGRHEAASHGSALFGFGVDLTALVHLGVLVRADSVTGGA
jgi:hypothetical protein